MSDTETQSQTLGELRHSHFMAVISVAPGASLAEGEWREGAAPWCIPVRNNAPTRAEPDDPAQVTDVGWRHGVMLNRVEHALYSDRIWSAVPPDAAINTELNGLKNAAGQKSLKLPWEILAVERINAWEGADLALIHLAPQSALDVLGVESKAFFRPSGHGFAPKVSTRAPGAALRPVADDWKELVGDSRGGSSALVRVLPQLGLTALDGYSLQRAAFLTFVHVNSTDPDPGSPWSGNHLRWWAWAMAHSTFNRDVLEARSEAPFTPGQMMTWPQMLSITARDGFGIVGTQSDTQQHGAQRFSSFLPIFRAVYGDILLLGAKQKFESAWLWDQLGAIAPRQPKRAEVSSLRQRQRLFHNRDWWRSASTLHWPDQILRAYQAQNALEDELRAVKEDLDSIDTEIRSLQEERINILLFILAAVGLIGVVAGVSQAVAAWIGLDTGQGWWFMATVPWTIFAIFGSLWMFRRLHR